ncbi:MAG TPA: flippase activity-associated protein Agl23 [Anaerolineae bacterium]|nr:flippase activity-associated protein Agl23 [Anaerolineae bacterium]
MSTEQQSDLPIEPQNTFSDDPFFVEETDEQLLTMKLDPNEEKPSVKSILDQPIAHLITLDWEKIAYLTIFILALISRLWNLGDRVVSHDESLHTQYSYQYAIGDGYSHTPLMHGPFLFHITAISYWLFGANDATARLPVALFGVALVLFPYLLRSWIGRRGALFASFVLLISPYTLYYSRYIRHDVYVIMWALMVFWATWNYLEKKEPKYLIWFAAGNALMAATKEVSFIYVAIFGSFLIVRLAPQLLRQQWFRTRLPQATLALLLLGGAIITLGLGTGLKLYASNQIEAANEANDAALLEQAIQDPPTATIDTSNYENLEEASRWAILVGFAFLTFGLILFAAKMRPHIDDFPEFDLIILYSTLLFPMLSPFFTTIAGWEPTDYSFTTCVIANQENMTTAALWFSRFVPGNGCWSHFFAQGLVRSGIFLLPTFAIAIYTGLWWRARIWTMAAGTFHIIFLLLYTSFLTNPDGWSSGMIGSLGYWIEQQEVQRGSQPPFYYLFVVPFYEFMPLIFSTIAIYAWSAKYKLQYLINYGLNTIVIAIFTFSFGNWVFNLSNRSQGLDTTILPGLIAAIAVLVLATLYGAYTRYQEIEQNPDTKTNWQYLLDNNILTGFFPSLVWWLLFTWAAYSYAGEKMPWLSIHFVIPMAFMIGWYFNEKLADTARYLLNRQAAIAIGLTVLALIMGFLTLRPLWLGEVNFGLQNLTNLSNIGRFLGTLIITLIIILAWWEFSHRHALAVRRVTWILGSFILLSILTMRFSYMSSFVNDDYVNEYLVYAHGAPATKAEVLRQLEDLSLRMYGDKSINVAYDNDSSWPLTWYLRDYPKRTYFGENPGRDIVDSPVVIVGSNNWSKVETLLEDKYQATTYTFLWWPMEDYRKLSWDAFLGYHNGNRIDDPDARKGIFNPRVRQAVWDIFFHRDYTTYGQVFGGNYTIGQWPLRHQLRFYVRKDVLANLWDQGVNTTVIEEPFDPYADKNFAVTAMQQLGTNDGNSLSQLNSPRNVAIGPDDNAYVLDSGNHRIVVFDADGEAINTWGTFGNSPGQFNEPWGIAVDDQYVYVADTWNHRIQKFTLAGEFVLTFGQSGAPEGDFDGAGLFFGPRDIALVEDDKLLVTDTGNHRTQLFDRDGNFIDERGEFGTNPGQYYEPVGLAVDSAGLIFIADTWNGRIQKLLPNLLPLSEWSFDGWYSESINNKPYVAVDSLDRVYVTDPEGYRVIVFDGTGSYLGRFGQFGTDLSSFSLINGITLDSDDNIYVVDSANNRILKFPPLTFDGSVAQPADIFDGIDVDVD